MRVLPYAVRCAWLMALLGLACGVVYSVGGLVVDLMTIGLNRGTALAFGALVGMPALFAAAGFLFGALASLIVNGLRAALLRGRN